MSEQTPSYLKASREELELIRELTAKPAFDRLDSGEAAVVEDDDWSDVPDLGQVRKDEAVIRLSKGLYDQLKAASEHQETSPQELACRWLQEKLTAAHETR